MLSNLFFQSYLNYSQIKERNQVHKKWPAYPAEISWKFSILEHGLVVNALITLVVLILFAFYMNLPLHIILILVGVIVYFIIICI